MITVDMSRARWRKAAASGANNGGCVEVAVNLPGVTALRDSTRPGDGFHVVTRAAFATLLSDVRAGKYDLED
jgi:uncharacterized protein DUF397